MAKEKLRFTKTDGSYFDITPLSGLKSFETHNQSNSQPKQIFYGVVPNEGSANILDLNGEIYEMLEDGDIETSNTPAQISLNDIEKSTHITTDSDYTENKEFIVNFTNSLASWDNIQFSGRDYTGSASLYTILADVLTRTLNYSLVQITSMLTNNIIVGNQTQNNRTTMTIKQYLENIIVGYDYLEKDTLRATIDKICTVAQLNVCENELGNIKFYSARPVAVQNGNILSISYHTQLSVPQKDMILKNKYDYVEISEVEVDDVIDYDTICHNKKYNQPTYTTTSENKQTTWFDSGYTNTLSIYARAYTASFTLAIPKKSNNNLQEIIKLLSGVNDNGRANISYSVNYTHTTIDVVNGVEQKTENEGSGVISDGSGYVTYVNTMGQTLSVSVADQTNNKTISIISSISSFRINVKILVGFSKEAYRNILGTSSTHTETYIPQSIEFTLYGNKRTISFDKKNNVGSGATGSTKKTVASISANTLLQSGTTYDNIKISDIIKNNILEDYSSGIATAKVDCVFGDINKIDGTKHYDWELGQSLGLNDIVQINSYNDNSSIYKKTDNSDIRFRIVGIETKFDGSPTQSLELQEVK